MTSAETASVCTRSANGGTASWTSAGTECYFFAPAGSTRSGVSWGFPSRLSSAGLRPSAEAVEERVSQKPRARRVSGTLIRETANGTAPPRVGGGNVRHGDCPRYRTFVKHSIGGGRRRSVRCRFRVSDSSRSRSQAIRDPFSETDRGGPRTRRLGRPGGTGQIRAGNAPRSGPFGARPGQGRPGLDIGLGD